MPDTQGQNVALNDAFGQVVLVNFWASWCPPCVHEMPSMAGLKTQLQGQPFEILAVNLGESKQQVEAFMIEHPLNFPVLLDEHGSAVQDWKIMAYPSSFLVDKTGKIRYALFGATDWQLPGHVQKIQQLLHE